MSKRIQALLRGEAKKLIIRNGDEKPQTLLPVDFTITDPVFGEVTQTLTFLYKDQGWYRVIASEFGPEECVLTYVRVTVTEFEAIRKHLEQEGEPIWTHKN